MLTKAPPPGVGQTGQPPGASHKTSAAAKPIFRVVSGFTASQLSLLRQQIVAFKKMKRNEWDFPTPGRPGVTAATHMAERRRNFPQTNWSVNPNQMGAGAAAAAAANRNVLAPNSSSFFPSANKSGTDFGAPRGRGRPPGAKNKEQNQHLSKSPLNAAYGTVVLPGSIPGGGGFYSQHAHDAYTPFLDTNPARREAVVSGSGPGSQKNLPRSITATPCWYVTAQRPLWELVDHGSPELMAGGGGRETHAAASTKPLPLHYDARQAIEAEADRRLEIFRNKRLTKIRDELKVLTEAEARRLNGGCGTEITNAGMASRDGTTGTATHDSLAQIRGAKRVLKIEEKSLLLVRLQDLVRAKLCRKQKELCEMGERGYKKTIKEGEKAKELAAKEGLKLKKREKEDHHKQIKEWRRVIWENAADKKELSVTKNRAIVKLHEKMAKEHQRRVKEQQAHLAFLSQQAAAALGKDQQGAGAQSNVEYQKRVSALKANDMEAYRVLLAEARGREGGVGGGVADGAGADTDERYASLQEFLEKTEGYLSQLGGKIAALKLDQQRSEAAAAAASVAEENGLSEDEILAAAEAAANAAAAKGGKDLLDVANKSADGDSKQKYYALAHTTLEPIAAQPKMLTAGTLRDYQIVSLQWMISLYNNKLNGILADEMGLGKTVQVCALIAYLWETKKNYGPHLIIVPNAVIVNWKSEIKLWLSKMEAVYYVGGREERAKIFTTQVTQLKFNVLVTTYEFIMRDRSKLSKVNWQYIVIDEAQRLKDREGRLSRDLDRFRCNRRLLLTGTPLQNDLSELWSLLNLLLPQVFDDAKIFNQWFGADKGSAKAKEVAKSVSSQALAAAGTGAAEEDWMEKEKKIIVVSRLHQILEPFMLRRLVQDVERKLPAKINLVIHCPNSAYQASTYDWVEKTGTIRVDQAVAKIGLAARANFRGYLPLQNRCMELRKLCNHPALNYPAEKGGDWRSGAELVRACGKLWVLDRLLVKLRASGHRVLLFSTMTKLLDLLEVYLRWRQGTSSGVGLEWCRIDGSTSLDDREVAINQFNAPSSTKFLFLLSIRAAGRGLNLQTADTVVVYDPDPNPKNEEQAVARSHRIGQKREVRCIYLEAVVDAVGAGRDEGGVGGTTNVVDVEEVEETEKENIIDDRTWGTGGERTYAESIESVVRNVIQAGKIEMADEIINAGRFDQQTTHAERRETLEKLMSDQATGVVKSCAAPSLRELNRELARSAEEVLLFDAMDADESLWPGPLLTSKDTPQFISYDAMDRDEAIASNAKPKPGRAGDLAEAKKAQDAQDMTGVTLGRGERSRGGYVPGAYRAADAALVGGDADAMLARAAAAAAAPKSHALTETPEPVEGASGEDAHEEDEGLEVIEAEDSEVTQNDDDDDDDDAGVVNFDECEKWEDEDDEPGGRIGPDVEDEEEEGGVKRKREEAE